MERDGLVKHACFEKKVNVEIQQLIKQRVMKQKTPFQRGMQNKKPFEIILHVGRAVKNRTFIYKGLTVT